MQEGHLFAGGCRRAEAQVYVELRKIHGADVSLSEFRIDYETGSLETFRGGDIGDQQHERGWRTGYFREH